MKHGLGTAVNSSAIAASVIVAALLLSSPAYSFGTVRGNGQNAEHARITRHALTCAEASDPNTCFQPDTLDNLAGIHGTFGSVGAPDRGRLNFESTAHCSAGDYFDAPDYPQSQEKAREILSGCRDHMLFHLDEAVRDARDLLDGNGAIRGSQIPTRVNCTFAGSKNGRAKCNVIAHFGYLLHTAQDFYSHTNWVDRADPSRPESPDNPPGLGNTGAAPWLDLRQRQAVFPQGLISGCFEPGSFISEEEHCVYGASKEYSRVRHLHLNKDFGTIDPEIGTGTTERGALQGNFRRAVEAAIADTTDKWATLRERLLETYGTVNGSRMICAIARDNPTRDC